MSRKTLKISVEIEDDILDRLRDLHKQATTDRSHYYVAKCCLGAITEIESLRKLVKG
jgi:hypothetical protein